MNSTSSIHNKCYYCNKYITEDLYFSDRGGYIHTACLTDKTNKKPKPPENRWDISGILPSQHYIGIYSNAPKWAKKRIDKAEKRLS